MKNLGDMIRFTRTSYAEQSKIQKNENSKPINLTFYLDYGVLRKEHLDTLTDFINRYETFKGSLHYNVKVLLPEAIIKLAKVTLKCNRLEAECYLNGIVAVQAAIKSFQRD